MPPGSSLAATRSRAQASRCKQPRARRAPHPPQGGKNARLSFYRHVLAREFGKLDGVVRAKRHRYVPVVLSHTETEAILGELPPPYRLVGLLLYGCGLRLTECVNLGLQCFHLDSMLLDPLFDN